jgi:DNA-binding MarR family transcriptional regulator
MDLPEGPPAMQVVVAAISCSRQIVRKLDRALASEDLTWAQLRALQDIDGRHGWTHASAVARRTGVSRQAASALFARLDERGFLTWMNEDWIRSVRLTAAGEDALARGWQSLSEVRDAINRLSVEERRAIVSAAESLRVQFTLRPWREPWYWKHLPKHLQDDHPMYEI